ncbi:hypothetical protein VTJ04DRAFT_4661 [Mycothermus thermophilus]|uniref:uncharacterized protein n=1 Tax=Humicola insolens TaxID=85995 RepID=UPI0037431377
MSPPRAAEGAANLDAALRTSVRLVCGNGADAQSATEDHGTTTIDQFISPPQDHETAKHIHRHRYHPTGQDAYLQRRTRYKYIHSLYN